jgi:GST-like protein
MSSATPVQHALLELQVPHEAVVVDFAKKETHTEAFLALNPNGKVPMLVVDGTPMFESLAIMQWLGARYGVERGLWPHEDAPERLQALSWTTWAYVSFGAVLSRYRFAGDASVDATLHYPAQREHAAAELQELLGILDHRLEGQSYLLGETFTLADLIVANVIVYATFTGVPVDAHANVKAWLARFQARPSFGKVWATAA